MSTSLKEFDALPPTRLESEAKCKPSHVNDDCSVYWKGYSVQSVYISEQRAEIQPTNNIKQLVLHS